jgi:hypothetical protein
MSLRGFAPALAKAGEAILDHSSYAFHLRFFNNPIIIYKCNPYDPKQITREKKMKKMVLGTALWLLIVFLFTGPANAQVSLQINIGTPPPVVFNAPPEMIVLPGTYVYVVPDMEDDIFFYDGYWYRPWKEHWYRSSYYDRDWILYKRTPLFYSHVPPGWRQHYRDHDWDGHEWAYERMPYNHVHKNWGQWKKEKHWEKERSWGVHDWQPGPQPKAAKQLSHDQEKHGHDEQPKAEKHQEHDQGNQDQGDREKHDQGHGHDKN